MKQGGLAVYERRGVETNVEDVHGYRGVHDLQAERCRSRQRVYKGNAVDREDKRCSTVRGFGGGEPYTKKGEGDRTEDDRREMPTAARNL